jgi:hypothetical protein
MDNHEEWARSRGRGRDAFGFSSSRLLRLATHNPLCPAFIMASRFRCPLIAFCVKNPQFRTMVHRFARRIPIEYGIIACEDAGSFDDCELGATK